MKKNEPLNRVLFTGALGWTDIKGGFSVDGSSLSFIVEEIISLSAVEILIPNYLPAAEFIDTLDPRIGARVNVVDAIERHNQFMSLLAPITEEFSVDYDGSFACGVTDKTVQRFLQDLYFNLDNYLLALHYKAEVDVDIEKLRRSTDGLRVLSRNPAARAILANLSGIFNLYTTVDVTGLKTIRPIDHSTLIESFNELLDDSAYIDATRDSHAFGFPSQIRRSVDLAREHLQKVVRHPRFKHLFNLGGKVITVATGAPIPNADAVGDLINVGFLPPIVDIDHAIRRGRDMWKQAKVEPIYPSIINERRDIE